MFFSSDMLSKRGPLARVWLAAHVERRLSKTQLLTTSIPQSVVAILDPNTTTAVPIALRLSGQLLLGVARIYGRKAKYLLDDCNDALLKIKMAFRTGGGAAAVDMSEEQEAAGREGINLKDRGGLLDFELMYGGGNAYDHWDLDLLNGAYESRAGLAIGTGNARIDADIVDITLPEHEAVVDGLDYDLDLNGLGGIDGQDYDMNLDLGLDFDLGLDESQVGANKAAKSKKRARSPTADGFNWDLGDDTLDMEVGRDAPGTGDRRSARESLGSALDAYKGADADITLDSGAGGFDGMDVDPPQWEQENFGGGDFDLTMDLGLDANGEGPALAPNSREATPVPGEGSEINGAGDNTVDVTPRTAKRIAAIPSPNKDSAKTKKSKKQIVDAVTELDAGPRGRGLGSQSSQSRQDRIDKGLIIEPTYLPRFREEFALREIQADPAKYFLPRIVERDGQDFMLIAPPGLCDELLDLFRYPVKPSLTKGAGKRKQDGAAVDEEGRPDKRARSQTVESEGVGRRRDGSLGVGFDMPFPEPDYDMGAGDMTGDDFRFDIDDVLPNGHDDGAAKSRGNAWNAEREPSLDLRGGVPDLTFDMPELGDSLLSIFDEDAAATQHETQAQQDAQPATKWSKNTVKALKVLKKELEPVEEEAEAEEKTMNFGEVSQKASRRAASAFFFELLVLGTRDCVKLEQKQPYGDFTVTGRDRLWEIIGSEGLAGNKEVAEEA